MNRKYLCGILTIATIFTSSLAIAEVVVIANPAVNASSITGEEIRKIYLGQNDTLPDGTKVAPVDLSEGSIQRSLFLKKFIGKDEFQFRSFWTRQLFTGKGRPPRVVASDTDVVRLVSQEKGLIGYVDSKAVTAKVKVLLTKE